MLANCIVLYRDNAQEAFVDRYCSPQREVGFKFLEIANTVGKVIVHLSGRHYEQTSEQDLLEDSKSHLVQSPVT